MARKKPDYKKAAEEASAALTAMKITKGAHGSYLGSGDRKWAIERLRRWCDLAEQHLSTEMIDQMAWWIEMFWRRRRCTRRREGSAQVVLPVGSGAHGGQAGTRRCSDDAADWEGDREIAGNGFCDGTRTNAKGLCGFTTMMPPVFSQCLSTCDTLAAGLPGRPPARWFLGCVLLVFSSLNTS